MISDCSFHAPIPAACRRLRAALNSNASGPEFDAFILGTGLTPGSGDGGMLGHRGKRGRSSASLAHLRKDPETVLLSDQ
jgi:hypothetical protein